jgi:hypothetical protein
MRHSSPTLFATKCVYLAAVLVLTSCTRKDDQNAGSNSALSTRSEASDSSPVRKHALLELLPETARSFAVIDLNTSGFKAYQGSAVAKLLHNETGIDSLSQIAEGAKEYAVIAQILADSGLFSTKLSQLTMADALLFVTQESSAAEPEFSLYQRHRTDFNPQEALKKAEQTLKERAIKTTTPSPDRGVGFTVLVTLKTSDKDAIPQEVPVTILVGTHESLITTSLTQSLTTLHAGKKGVQIQSIKSTPLYQRAIKAVPSEPSEWLFGYVDLKDAEQLPTEVRATPEAILSAETQPALDSEGLIFSYTADPIFMARGAALIKPVASATSEKPSPLNYNSHADGETMLTISIDGAPLRYGIEGLLPLAAAAEGVTSKQKEFAQQLLTVEELGIISRAQTGAAPFPELAILLSTKKAKEIAAGLKDVIGAGVEGQGFLSGFQRKEINGLAVDYSLSPFGVGIFIGSTADTVILASSESILTSFAKDGTKKEAVPAQFEERNYNLVVAENLAASGIISFPKIATAIDGLSASLGIFTGGKPLVEEQQLTLLRGLGSAAFSIELRNDAVNLVFRGPTGETQ